MLDTTLRIRGTLLGLAAGEALGAPLEFMSPNQIQIKHATVVEMVGGGWLGLRPGEGSDDTAMALALASSLVEKKGLDVADVVSRYLAWYRKGPKGIANTVRAALAYAEQGLAPGEASRRVWEESGESADDNGAIARAAPLGVYYHRDTRVLLRAAMEEARITHHDPRAGSGSASLALLLAGILGGAPDRKALVDAANATLIENEEGVQAILPDVGAKTVADLRPTENIVDTIETALVCFLKTSSFRDCLVTAVNLGGSSATVGAVAGSLAGCWYGADAIPASWLSVLADRNRIEQITRQLAKAATA
ncbi:MAG: ADP-ribosylglycohydrolase family protein [Planctomycetes bacterium]|nr:ADP-ribosylglycohydrolase family protein [Planctomycetota bacterium]